MSLFGVCNACGGPLILTLTGRLVCPRPYCTGDQPHKEKPA